MRLVWIVELLMVFRDGENSFTSVSPSSLLYLNNIDV